ncbi:MAG: hypothetical protein OIF55_19255 [Amphritea sp.]|nr:hypothetical protein [Amphritea sp.]
MTEAVAVDLVERALSKRRANQAREDGIAAGNVVVKSAVKGRLEEWARFKVDEASGSLGGAGGNVIARLMESQGELIRSTAGEPDMPVSVADTDRAVKSIESRYQRVIVQQYLEAGRSVGQKAKAAGCPVSTYYRWLASAHDQVVMFLSAPKRQAVAREAMLKRMKKSTE